ncbi:katanin p60 ATPase-containing subunit A1 [Tanacetum coccineum]
MTYDQSIKIFEIVNFDNELLSSLPNGTITLPASTNVFVKGSLLKKSLAGSSSKQDKISGGKRIVNGQIGQEDIPAAEDISCESTLVDDNIDKAPKEEEIPSIEGATTIETQVDAESQTKSEDIQSVEDRSSLSKATYTIEEGATEDTESTPNIDLEKEEKDNELISEVQSTPKALPKMGIKGEHREATDEKCETLTGGELCEKFVMFAPYYFNAYMSFQMTGVTDILVGHGDPNTLHPDTADRPELLVHLVKIVTDISLAVESGEFYLETYMFKYDTFHGQWKHHELKVKDKKTLLFGTQKRSNGVQLKPTTVHWSLHRQGQSCCPLKAFLCFCLNFFFWEVCHFAFAISSSSVDKIIQLIVTSARGLILVLRIADVARGAILSSLSHD